MSHAEKCPVCKGKGKVEISDIDKTSVRITNCHGCYGLGWVTVGMDYPVFYSTYPVYPQPIYPDPNQPMWGYEYTSDTKQEG